MAHCPVGSAIDGGSFVLPFSSTGKAVYSKQSGMQLLVDTTWIGEHGYRPVMCRFQLSRPAPADIQVTVRFAAGWRTTDEPLISVEQDFEIPAGSSSAEFTLSIPEYTQWRYVGITTWIDGVRDEDLSVDFNQHPQSNISRGGYTFGVLGLGFVNQLDISRLLHELRGAPADTMTLSDQPLPDHFIDYSSFDLVTASVSEIDKVAANQPGRFAEMLRWVRAGGNLWLFETGVDYEDVARIEKILSLPEQSATSSDVYENLQERGWRFPRIDNPGTDAVEKLRQLRTPRTLTETDDLQNTTLSERDSRKWFTTRLYGMGTVTAFRDLFQFRGSERLTNWAITQSLLSERLSWVTRHGNDPDEGNPNFNDWLIPEVGTAPVTAFQLLLTLFVLGIGPVNYLLLKRREQLPLLLLSVPAAACATILMLVVYSFLSDGFGAQVRARSFTLLDQRSSTATCWARLSYFASIAPPSGLEYPSDTLIYPIHPASRAGNRRLIRNLVLQPRELQWSNSQELKRGWLASRTPTQYLTISSRRSPQEVVFQNVEEGLQATNHLGVDILLMAVSDLEGAVHLVENLPAGESKLLMKSSQVQAMTSLRKMFSDNAPQFPPGTVESLSSGENILAFPFSLNLMEAQLSAISSAATPSWGTRTFIAVTDRGVDLSLGMEDLPESASFHVVRGEW